MYTKANVNVHTEFTHTRKQEHEHPELYEEKNVDYQLEECKKMQRCGIMHQREELQYLITDHLLRSPPKNVSPAFVSWGRHSVHVSACLPARVPLYLFACLFILSYPNLIYLLMYPSHPSPRPT